jgi:hypothetical protein
MMRRAIGYWPLAALLLLASWAPLSACSKDRSDGDGQQVAWPDRPADGSPVAFEFVELTGEGDRREARLRIFNFTDKPVQGVQMTLHYLDADGEEIDTFPWGATAPVLVAANNQTTMTAGAFMPEATASVRVSVSQVTFQDGTSWQGTRE